MDRSLQCQIQLTHVTCASTTCMVVLQISCDPRLTLLDCVVLTKQFTIPNTAAHSSHFPLWLLKVCPSKPFRPLYGDRVGRNVLLPSANIREARAALLDTWFSTGRLYAATYIMIKQRGELESTILRHRHLCPSDKLMSGVQSPGRTGALAEPQ